MKRLSSIFLVISFAVLAICNSSCKSSGSEEELGPHNKVPSAENFRSYIISNGGFGTAQILDYRSETDFKAGHIKGAKNITATAQNTASDDAQFCNGFSISSVLDDARFAYVPSSSKVPIARSDSNFLISAMQASQL